MQHLTFHDTPAKNLDHMVVVFSGWADAAEGATSAVKFLQRKLQSKKFADIDPEELGRNHKKTLGIPRVFLRIPGIFWKNHEIPKISTNS